MHTLSSQNLANLIGLAQSEDGFRFQVALEPLITLAKEGLFAEYEVYGVEDGFYIMMNPQAIAAHPRMIITQSFIFLDFSSDFMVKTTYPCLVGIPTTPHK